MMKQSQPYDDFDAAMLDFCRSLGMNDEQLAEAAEKMRKDDIEVRRQLGLLPVHISADADVQICLAIDAAADSNIRVAEARAELSGLGLPESIIDRIDFSPEGLERRIKESGIDD